MGGDLQVDEDLAVYWVNTWSNGALVRQKEGAIISSSSFDIQSFFNHSFLVVEQQVRRVQVGQYNENLL